MKRLCILWTLAGCSVPAITVKDADDGTETDPTSPDSDVESDEPVESGAWATGTPAADSDADDSDAPVPDPVVRFIALGDAGEGNADQHLVAQAIETVCAARGCEFALYLGDNFYDGGVYSVDDDQFQTKFEIPYANLDFPFYIVLGNHDFGEVPIEFWRTDFQIAYASQSTKWTMPDHFYSFSREHAFFMGLDTNMLMLGLDATGAQIPWFRNEITRSTSFTWRIAFGHHPWKSNGEHGNAGNYEGAWFDVTGLVRGDLIQDFFQDEMCQNVDLYFNGHDHNRQWISAGPRCGVEMITSGSGAKTTGLVGRDGNPTLFEDDTTEGFVWVELNGRTATLAFYDKNGTLDHEGIITK